MEEKQIQQPKKPAPIDFGAMWAAIKKHRKLYCYVLSVAFVLALVICFSIPKTYNCQIILAPEMGGSTSVGTLGSLASSFGIDLGSSSSQGGDGIKPSIYPDLMMSSDFKITLFPVKVKRKRDKQTMTYYDYLKNEWKYPWWETCFGLINKNVVCSIDKKTNLITIHVTAQDPYVAGLLADSVKTRLQDFLTNYKTSKARHDLEYAEMLLRQAKKDYEHARRLYVDFMDTNNDLMLMSAQQKQIDLENEMQLQYNNYTAISAQVIAAKAKVQEVTPAFTPLQSASVPLGPSSPKKPQIILITLLVAIFGTTIYILIKENQLKSLLGLS